MFTIKIHFKNTDKSVVSGADFGNKSGAMDYAHKVALHDTNIRTVTVHNGNGSIVGGYSRAVGNLKSLFSK